METLSSSTEDPVRVGFVMHRMQVAGAEVLVKQIIETLGPAIQPSIFCLDGIGELGFQLEAAGVPVISFDRMPGFDRSVAKRLADEVVDRRIEVLHAHQYTPFFYSALSRLWYRADCKVLFTEHGRHYPDIVSFKRRITNRLVLQRYAEETTACCDFSTRALIEKEGFSQAYTLHNGVEVKEIPPRGSVEEREALRLKLGLDLDRPYAACVARFHPVKDHATAIRGWFQVFRSIPRARLLLVGGGEEELAMRKLVAELDASVESDLDSGADEETFADSIQFLGIRHDVCEILRAVDVFTLTSVSEAASLTLLEAMASECPCVVTDVGGNSEHLRDGKEGFLVPRGDDHALAIRLIEVLSDSELARRFGEASRTRVLEKFDLDQAVLRYFSIYQKLSGAREGRV